MKKVNCDNCNRDEVYPWPLTDKNNKEIMLCRPCLKLYMAMDAGQCEHPLTCDLCLDDNDQTNFIDLGLSTICEHCFNNRAIQQLCSFCSEALQGEFYFIEQSKNYMCSKCYHQPLDEGDFKYERDREDEKYRGAFSN